MSNTNPLRTLESIEALSGDERLLLRRPGKSPVTGQAKALMQQEIAKADSTVAGQVATLARSLDAEVQARGNADAAEAKSRGDADAAEAKARADADKAITARLDAIDKRMVPYVATLTMAAGLKILAGKSEQIVPVPGLKAGDHVVVTPNAKLPSTVEMCECMCLADGQLTVTLNNTAVLGTGLQMAATIPLGIVALRP